MDNSFTADDTGEYVQRMDLKILAAEVPHGLKGKVEEALKSYVPMIKGKAETDSQIEPNDGNDLF